MVGLSSKKFKSIQSGADRYSVQKNAGKYSLGHVSTKKMSVKGKGISSRKWKSMQRSSGKVRSPSKGLSSRKWKSVV